MGSFLRVMPCCDGLLRPLLNVSCCSRRRSSTHPGAYSLRGEPECRSLSPDIHLSGGRAVERKLFDGRIRGPSHGGGSERSAILVDARQERAPGSLGRLSVVIGEEPEPQPFGEDRAEEARGRRFKIG